MTTFTTCFDAPGTGPVLAIKDLIDQEGVVTTAGCRALARHGTPAARDAACLAGARAAGARIVGRTNLHELAMGVTGVNPWYGTPVNPLDPARIPGGSSSGSAVAVATGEADVAYGSDTGGSVRIPSACCGTAGLKTTWGRVSLEGVWPLAPSFDTVGPMARDVAGLVLGMGLLEPGFAPGREEPWRVGRLSVAAEPEVDAAVDAALAATRWEVVPVTVPGWEECQGPAGTLVMVEAWTANGELATRWPEDIGSDVMGHLTGARSIEPDARLKAAEAKRTFTAALEEALAQVDLLALPTIPVFPPTIDGGDWTAMARCTMPVNLAGVPAISLPVPGPGPLPASLQLIGPAHSEERLVAAGAVAEAAARSLS
jgi:amidase